MSVNATSTKELNIGQIIRRSYQLAGLLNTNQSPPPEDMALGKDMLEVIVDELQAKGVYARSVGFVVLDLTVGTSTYSLPETVFDVFGVARYIPESEDPEAPTSEFSITQMDSTAWQQLGNKAQEGQPSRYYAHRQTEPIQVWLDRAPQENGYIRFQTHRLLSDNNDTNKTPDLERSWFNYLIWELGHQLGMAKNIPLARCQYMHGVAETKLKACIRHANEHTETRFIPRWR